MAYSDSKKKGRSPSAESSLRPNSRSSTSSRRSAATMTVNNSPRISPDGISPIPSTSSINLSEMALPVLPDFILPPISNGKNGSSPVKAHKSRANKRRGSISSIESSNETDALTVTQDSNRHASSSLSDQSSKSASPEPSVRISPEASGMKLSSSKMDLEGNSSESDTSTSLGGTRRHRTRPRVPTRAGPKARGGVTTSGATSKGMNSPIAMEIPIIIARATRATVALPPGYIEGVKSTRMPKGGTISRTESDGVEEEMKKKVGKGKGKERESSAPVEVEVEVEMEVEMEVEVEVEVEAVEEEAPPERVFSKRRKIEDDLIAERANSRARLLQQLDEEAELISNETHPLIQHTFQKLTEEKEVRLAQLLDLRNHQERQIDRNLDVETEAVWRQWADAKDSLRMDLYLTNHNNLKQLISEEREYPFLRDHPLLVNSHGLPPVPYYRAPLPPPVPGEVRRHDIRSTAHLQPPPINRAIDHSTWKLTTQEIDSDLAIFADFNSNSLSRSYSMTIEQPYGAVHYAPASTPPVFQPPSASLASSAYFSSQHHANSPRLPHDNAPSRPPNIFPQPSTIKPMWATPGKPNLGHPHHNNSHPPPSLPNKSIHSNVQQQRIPRPNGTVNSHSQSHGEAIPRPRADSATSTMKPIDPANWFAQPIGHQQQARPVEPERRPLLPPPPPRQAINSISEPVRLPPNITHPKRPVNGTTTVVRPPVKLESWENWRPKVRESTNNNARTGPNHQWNNGVSNPTGGVPIPVVNKVSAFAAYEPQAIPLFGQKIGEKVGVIRKV